MKAGPPLKCLFWATLYCVLYLVSASDEELVDFDFSDLKEIDWNYDNENASNDDMAVKGSDNRAKKKNLHENIVTFEDYDSAEQENQVRPFDWRENVLKTALSKALTNSALRQKFVEVMPILRVLSSQQRLALSALISAQINAKKGQELKLEQVRMMFGDDKKLLIPIVYDIANLVRNSARKFLDFDEGIMLAAKFKQTPIIGRRKIDLTSAEEQTDQANGAVGTIAAGGSDSDDDVDSLEEFFGDMPDDVLDPQSINEALQAGATRPSLSMPVETKNVTSTTGGITTTTTNPISSTTKTTTKAPPAKRARRSAISPNTFVHKLIRSVPLSVNEQDLMNGAAGRTVKMNTTGFNSDRRIPIQTVPSQQQQTPNLSATPAPYQAIEDLALAQLNGTIVNSTGHDNSDLEPEPEQEKEEVATAVDHDGPTKSDDKIEHLPSPEELIGGPRYRMQSKGGAQYGNTLHMGRPKVAAKRKRVQVRSRPKASKSKGRPAPSQLAQGSTSGAPSKKCERFTSSMCIRTDDYPLDKIMGSIRRHKNAMSALLAEYYDKPGQGQGLADANDDFDDYAFNKKRREDEFAAASSTGSVSVAGGSGGGGGGMCQSVVRYARPQKARSASGEWKYIVNTGQHTQTLRLEKCMNPQESCSYLAQNYRSHCSQVYNYHRLLSWDKTRGLHVDIFKVPTCCSCQVDGYRQQFPPLSSIKSKDFTPAYSASDLYSTINEDLDYNDEDDDEDDLSYQYDNGFGGAQHRKRHRTDYDAGNELLLGSKKVRTQVYASRPTVGSYLSPPDHDEYDTNFAQSKQRVSAAIAPNKYPASRRRPYKSLDALNEARVDLDLSPSEKYAENKEVNIFGTPYASDKMRTHPKRKHIYSVPHSATSTSTGLGFGFGTGFGSNAAKPHSNNGIHGTHYTPTIPNVTSSQGAAAAAAAGVATNAHQKPTHPEAGIAVPSTYYTNSHALAPHVQGFGKAQSRFHANVASARPTLPTTTTTAATAAESPYRYHQQATANFVPNGGGGAAATATAAAATPTSNYAVNSIFSAKYNNASNSHNHADPGDGGSSDGGGGPKRINYSYHPIIDFFENHRRSATVVAASPAAASNDGQQTSSTELLYPYTVAHSNGHGYRERRIGFGPASSSSAKSDGGGGGGGSGVVGVGDDNLWHPVIIEP